MNAKIGLALCLLLGGNAWAQQKPHYTQYLLNQYILNPALTGIENYTDVKLSHRHQWAGISDAPVTTYFTIHTPIGKKDFRTSATSYRIPGENPRGKQYWEAYTAAEPHHGVGLQVLADRTGPLSSYSAMLTYAYHIGISPRTSLAAGFGAGVSQVRLNTSKLDFGQANPVDPAAYSNSESINRIKPDFTAGLYLYSADFFAGLSAQQIIPQRLVFAEDDLRTLEGKQVPHLFLTAGYRLLVNEDFNVIPSVMLKYVSPLPLQADFNIKCQYLDLAWLGAGYRTRDGFSAMLGINVSNTLNIGYSYDYSTSGLQTVSNGSHEIVLGLLIGNKYGDWCPKNVW